MNDYGDDQIERKDEIGSATGMTRRSLLKVAGSVAALGAVGFPAIVRAKTKPVKVGFLTALTGLEAILGETQLNCFKIAVDEINAHGGLLGSEVSYVVEDDETTTQGTQNKARKLIYSDNVDVIIGLISSLEHVAAQAVTIPAKRLLMYTTYYEGGVCNKYFVATGQVPNQQVDPTVPWLMKNVGKSVYIMGSDYIWPKKSAVLIKAAVERHGGKILGERFFPFGTQDFGSVLREIEKLRPAVVWDMTAGSDALTSLKQYRSYGLKPQLVSAMDEIFSTAQPKLAAGSLSNMSYFMTLKTARNKEFLKKYRAKYGNKPVDAIGASTYDAMWLYAKAVNHAGTTDTDKVIKALPQVKFDAPQGDVNIFAQNNQMVNHSLLGRAREDGMWDIVEDFGRIDPKVPGCHLR